MKQMTNLGHQVLKVEIRMKISAFFEDDRSLNILCLYVRKLGNVH